MAMRQISTPLAVVFLALLSVEVLSETPDAAETPAPAPASTVTESPDFQFGKPVKNTWAAFQEDMWTVLTNKKYQWAVAIPAFVVGLLALWDGNRLFRLLVMFGVASFTYCFILSQLKYAWTDTKADEILKVVLSVVGGLFMAAVAFVGWGGTQLLVGFTVGVYCFQIMEGLALFIPNSDAVVHGPQCMTIMFTVAVALGVAAVHERACATRTFAILAPLVGSTLVVAVLSYLAMFVKASQSPTMTPADVPSVFEYWYMIAVPMKSKAVGFFATDSNSSTPLELDRVIGVLVEIVLACSGICMQWKSASRKKTEQSAGLAKPLLANDVEKAQPPKRKAQPAKAAAPAPEKVPVVSAAAAPKLSSPAWMSWSSPWSSPAPVPAPAPAPAPAAAAAAEAQPTKGWWPFSNASL